MNSLTRIENQLYSCGETMKATGYDAITRQFRRKRQMVGDSAKGKSGQVIDSHWQKHWMANEYGMLLKRVGVPARTMITLVYWG